MCQTDSSIFLHFEAKNTKKLKIRFLERCDNFFYYNVNNLWGTECVSSFILMEFNFAIMKYKKSLSLRDILFLNMFSTYFSMY